MRFYNLDAKLIGDTNILDLDQSVFTKSEDIIEESINGSVKQKKKTKSITTEQNQSLIQKKYKEYKKEPIIISETIQNNFFVSTLSKIKSTKLTLVT